MSNAEVGSLDGSPVTILVVDDDEAVRRVFTRFLQGAGFAVDLASDGRQALACIANRSYSVILADISMPGMDGIAMLKAVRRHDKDVPVILITGAPAMDTALAAMEHGAFNYLPKPVERERLVDVVRRAGRLHALAKLKRQAVELAGGDSNLAGDRIGLELQLDHALDLSWLAYQPILSFETRRVFAYEALLRSDDRDLSSPFQILQLAERLGRVPEVGRVVRQHLAADLPGAPSDVLLFLNAHPLELLDPSLRDPASPLCAHAHRVVVELTERAALDEVGELGAVLHSLRGLGFRLAIDDLGAGYAGLSSLTLVQPEFVKLDISLVRGIDAAPLKAQVVRSMLGLCGELGMKVVAEGVEAAGERDVLLGMGADLLQGYLLARPGRGFAMPAW